MRVLHLVSTLESGGIASSVAYLLPELDAIPGIQVDVATLYGSGHFAKVLEREGLTPFRLDLRRRYDHEAPRRLRCLLERGRYDIVHTHGWPALGLAALARPRTPNAAKLVTTEHNVTNRRRRRSLRALDRRLYGPYDRIIAVSQAVADSLAAWQPSIADRITTIHNGIRPELSQAAPNARPRLRKELELPSDGKVVIAVGRLIEQKGIDVLLDAMHQIDGEQPHLLLAGAGILQPELERQAESLGLADRVHFLGFRPDVPDLLATADVFVLPSRWEGCPMVLLEAFAAGLPVVATPVGGVPEMLEQGRHGSIVPVENAAKLAEALADLLGDAAKRESLAEAGRERIAERFEASDLARTLVGTYELELTGSRNEDGPRSKAPAKLDPAASQVRRALGFLIDQIQARQADSSAIPLNHPATRPFEPAFRLLIGSDLDAFDESDRSRIQNSFRRTAATNLIHQESLATLVSRFEEEGIPTLLLKGIVTSETLYPSIGARAMVDIDVLVPEDKVNGAAALLGELGYLPEDAIVADDGRIDQLTKSIGTFQQSHVNAAEYPQSTVDLHWNLINVLWFRLASDWPMEDLRSRARSEQIGRTPVLVLDPLDSILHLAYHQAVKHHLADVKDFLDIDLICRQNPELLYELPARARKARFRSATFHALAFSQALFNTPIPDRVLDELCPDPLRLLLVRRIVRAEELLEARPPRLNIARGFLLNMLMIDRWRDLLKIAWRSIWPDSEWLQQRMQMAGVSDGSARLWHWKRLGSYVGQALRPRGRKGT